MQHLRCPNRDIGCAELHIESQIYGQRVPCPGWSSRSVPRPDRNDGRATRAPVSQYGNWISFRADMSLPVMRCATLRVEVGLAMPILFADDVGVDGRRAYWQ